MSFTYLKKNCPICAGARIDCRQSTSTSLIHCRDTEANPLGFTFMGVDKIGFGMWADSARTSAASQEEQQQWRREPEAQKQQRLKEEKERCAAALTEEERDTEIKKILGQLDLKPAHREDLRRRGLSDAQIEAGQFRSVVPWQRLKVPVSNRLAGVALDGLALLTKAGYLCPMRNLQGLLVGWQLLADSPEDGGKYRWPTSRTSKRPNGPTAHLKNGELPVQVARPDGVPNGSPGLIEGALKPYIAAQLSGQVMVGAAGGNFLPSCDQLVAALQTLCAELNTQTITLYPDAGSAANLQVFQRDADTVRFLQQRGFTVRIASWGQLRDKNAPDFDELLAAGRAGEISYLTAETYLNLSADAPDSPWAADPATGRARREWGKYSKLTQPTIEISQRYLNVDIESLVPAGIYAIKSPMDSGKTELLKTLCRHFPTGNVVSYRNSLLQNTATRVPELDFLWNLDTGEPALNRLSWRNSKWVAACLDSLEKLGDKPVLVIEEAGKAIDHLLRGNTCRKRRGALLKNFEHKVRSCTHIFLLDADLADPEIDYLRQLRPDLSCCKLVNTGAPPSWPIHWYTGVASSKGFSANNFSLIHQRIQESIAAGEIPMIVSDSQVFLEATDKLLRTLYPERNGLRVDSLTKVEDPCVNNFLSNPDAWLALNRPSWLFLSPTGESSLDISQPYFTTVYGVFFGTVSCFSARQMLGRYRLPVERHVWCAVTATGTDGQASQVAGQVISNLQQYAWETLREIGLAVYLRERAEAPESALDLVKFLTSLIDEESQQWADPHLAAYSKLEARANYQKANLRATLRELLLDAGHRIVEEVAGEPTDTGYKKQRREILEQRCQQIAAAPDISIEEAKRINASQGATPAESAAAEKAFLKVTLPGFELSAESIYWFKYDKRNILSQLQILWMARHLECQRQLDSKQWQQALLIGTPIWDVRTSSLAISVLRELGVLEMVAGSGEFSASDEKIQRLKQRALGMASRLKLALGISVTAGSDPIYLCRRLAEKLGYTLRSRQVRTKGGRQRVYSFVQPESDSRCAAVLAAYDRRWSAMLKRL
ncbi:MAG: hypothetical protein MUC60_09905 [Oscillatoria sp. Prado101]|jgi:hypothetical protein|nr:hypothetical protein [Oscillatoria sp. Prado101]